MKLFKKKPNPVGRPREYEYKIKWTGAIPSGGLPSSGRKKKPKPLTQRKKKIAVSNLEGGGLGFVVGGTVAGLGGMIVGFPVGVIAGNIYGKKKFKRRGRQPKYLTNTFGKQVLNPKYIKPKR